MHRPDAPTPDPQLSVRPDAPRQGEIVILSLDGFAPREKMALTLDAVATDDRIERDVRADRHGRIDAAVRLPDAPEAQRWSFAARSSERDLGVSCGPVFVLPAH